MILKNLVWQFAHGFLTAFFTAMAAWVQGVQDPSTLTWAAVGGGAAGAVVGAIKKVLNGQY